MLRRLRSLWAGPLRPWVQLAFTAGLAVLCAVWAVLAWRARSSWAQQSTVPLRDPLANLNQIGINVDATQYDAGQLDRILDRAAAAGFRWVRQRFPWDEIEPQPGVLDWDRWDGIVAACAARDLALIAVLDGTPAWARDAGFDTPLAPPREVSDWGSFAAGIAARYRGQIAAYQLWDEPNLSGHWGGRYVDPVGYAALLREGAVRIRDADPGATILLAALAPTVETGPLNLNEIDFFRRVIQAGGAPFFDVVALQPYGFGDPPGAMPDPAALNFCRVELLRREMVRQGLDDRPVWATAWGWNHLPPGWEGAPSPWPSVSSEQQVAYTLDALQRARREWPWLGPMILYGLQPDVPVTDPHWGFALLDSQGTASPLYERFEDSTAQQPLYTGVYAPSRDIAQVAGEWRFSDAGADPPHGADESARNATLSFDAHGTALDLTVRRGDFWGVLYVSIDGAPANGLPRDEYGRAYLVLHDPAGQVETVPLARGLSKRSHHVEIVAHGGWGQWPVVGWTVYDEQLPPPAASTVWMLGLLAAGAALAAGGQIALVPELRQPVYGAIGRAFRWYRALPEWIPVLATAGTAMAFYALPWAPAALALLALFFALTFLRIDLGLATVAFALPFYLRPKVLLGRPFSVVELGMAICLGAWLLARLLDLGRAVGRDGLQSLLRSLRRPDPLRLRQALPRLWHRWTGLDKGVLALLLVAAISLDWAAHREVALRELRTVFAASALFYALVRVAVRSPRAHQRLIEGWLLGAVVVSAIGIVQLLTGRNLIAAEGVWRVRGLYGSPNNLALYLERALPVLLAVAWQGRRRTHRLVYGFAALPVLAALVMTLSKGALLIGLPAALLALGLLQRNRRATWIALSAVAVIGLLVLPFGLTERFRSILNLRAGTAFFRLKLWRSSLSMIADHPLTGVGMDNFLYAYRSRYVLPSAWAELDLSHPHNLLLDAWTRLGIGGVAAIAWLFTAFFRTTWRQLRTAAGDRRALLLGLLAAAVGALAHGMVDHAVFLIDLAFVFALILAMAHPAHSS